MPQIDVDALVERVRRTRLDVFRVNVDDAPSCMVLDADVRDILALLAALREARADGERLDFLWQTLRPLHPPLESDAVSPQHRHAQDDQWCVAPAASGQQFAMGDTPRNAIDAARAAGEPK